MGVKNAFRDYPSFCAFFAVVGRPAVMDRLPV